KDSDESRERSIEAKEDAEEAKHRSDITKKQLEQALIEDDQVYEVQTLRVDPVTGETYSTAADRFEANQIDLNDKISETEVFVDSLYLGTGVIPERFPTFPNE